VSGRHPAASLPVGADAQKVHLVHRLLPPIAPCATMARRLLWPDLATISRRVQRPNWATISQRVHRSKWYIMYHIRRAQEATGVLGGTGHRKSNSPMACWSIRPQPINREKTGGKPAINRWKTGNKPRENWWKTGGKLAKNPRTIFHLLTSISLEDLRHGAGYGAPGLAGGAGLKSQKFKIPKLDRFIYPVDIVQTVRRRRRPVKHWNSRSKTLMGSRGHGNCGPPAALG